MRDPLFQSVTFNPMVLIRLFGNKPPPLPEMSDMELIQLYQAGNDEAIATIFKRYYDELIHLSYAILVDTIFADEIISQVLEGYLTTPRKKRKKKYGIVSTARGFLRKTIVRKCIDYNRKKINQIRKIPLETTHQSAIIPADLSFEQNVPQERTTSFEERQLLDMILAQLVGNEREVFNLYLRGYSHQEICEMLQLSTTRNVSSTLYNARKKAQAIYSQ